MRRIRRYSGPAVTSVLALYFAVVTLGALRVCWAEHTHNGAAAADCPMHHHAPGEPGASAHHQHGGALPAASGSGTQITCTCSSDQSSIDVGPIGILLPAGAMLLSNPQRTPPPAYAEALPDPSLKSLSPPPRSLFSA